DMVRCARILEIIEDEQLVAHAAQIGLELQAGLARLESKWEGFVSNARGLGLMCALDLPDKDARDAVVRAAYALGVIVLRCGERSVRLRPALDVRSDDVRECCELLDAAVAKAAAGSESVPSNRRRAERTRA